MHHVNTVRDVAARLQDALKQDQELIENATTVPEPFDHVSNTLQINQNHLDTQLHHMKAIMQAKQMQYAAAPHHTHQNYGGRGYLGGYTGHRGREGRGAQCKVNWRGGRSGWGNNDLTHYCWTHGMCAHPSK